MMSDSDINDDGKLYRKFYNKKQMLKKKRRFFKTCK